MPPRVVYREGVVGRPESITPVTARSRAERTLVGLVFSGLVRLGPGTTYQPDLADVLVERRRPGRRGRSRSATTPSGMTASP